MDQCKSGPPGFCLSLRPVEQVPEEYSAQGRSLWSGGRGRPVSTLDAGGTGSEDGRLTHRVTTEFDLRGDLRLPRDRGSRPLRSSQSSSCSVHTPSGVTREPPRRSTERPVYTSPGHRHCRIVSYPSNSPSPVPHRLLQPPTLHDSGPKT